MLTIFSLNAHADIHEYENSFPLKGEFYLKNNSEKTLYLVLVSKIEKDLAQKIGINEISTVRKKLLPREDATIKSSVLYDEISYWSGKIGLVVRFLKNLGIEQTDEGERVFLDVSDVQKFQVIPGNYSIELVDEELIIKQIQENNEKA